VLDAGLVREAFDLAMEALDEVFQRPRGHPRYPQPGHD
jgi:hypothetical protein